MKVIELEGVSSNNVVEFNVSNQQENVKFLENGNALEDLGKLYKKRLIIRKRKFIDKGILSQEFGKPL